MCRRSHFKEKKGQIHECGKQERVIKRRKITAGEETSAAAQGWIFSTSGAVHQAAVEEWRGAAAPLSLTVWFKELLFASLALCLSVALKGRELCLCSLIGICLKNNKKKSKKNKGASSCVRVVHTEPPGQPLSDETKGIFPWASHDLFTLPLMVKNFLDQCYTL